MSCEASKILVHRQAQRRGKILWLACRCVGLVVSAGATFAADRSWGNSGGGTFSTASNWVNGLIAGVNDVAKFDRSRGTSQTTYIVTFSASAQNQAVSVVNDLVTFNLNGKTYTTTAINGSEIGTSSSTTLRASLTLQNGTFNMTGALTPNLLVGAAPGAIGSLTLSNNATLTGAPNLLVGTTSATGFLTLNGLSGGTATISTLSLGSGAGGRGSCGLSGPFAAMTTARLLVGDQGFGTMSLDVSARLTNTGTAILGNASGSTGLVALDTSARWVQNGSLVVGNSGAGTINLLNGGSFLGQVGVLGALSSGTGRLNIDGPNSKAALGNITIGDAGAASVTVSNGAILTRLLGTFTQIVGNSGSGFVDLSSGGKWLTDGTTTLGSGTNSIGQVDVRGLGSQWHSGTLTVGNQGSGTVNISGQSGLVSTNATFGFETNSSGLGSVDGVGSAWANVGTMTIGRNGAGTLRVTNGGRVNNSGGDVIARGRGSSVLVDGQDSELITDTFRVSGGFGLEAQLVISGGGIVQSSNGELPDIVGGGAVSATVSGSNSHWSITNSLFVGFNTFDASGPPGSLTINSGALVEAGSLRLGNDGTISLSGGTLRVAILAFEATPTFNFNSGLLRITGNPTLSATFLDKLLGPAHQIGAGRQISIGGIPTLTAPLVLDGGVLSIPDLTVSSAGQLDMTSSTMVVDYTASSPLNNIAALLSSGFAGGSWNGTGINSSIAAVTPNRAVGFAEATDLFTSFPTTFMGQTVDDTSILIRLTVAGDATLDGTVNSADFNVLASNFGSAGKRWSQGDFSFDAGVNSADFNILASNFGQSLAAGQGMSVPEPAAIGTLLVTAGLMARGRMRSRMLSQQVTATPPMRASRW